MKLAEQNPPASYVRASFHLQFLSCCPVGPHSPPEHGFVAQSEERAVVNRWVAGSIPAGTANGEAGTGNLLFDSPEDG